MTDSQNEKVKELEEELANCKNLCLLCNEELNMDAGDKYGICDTSKCRRDDLFKAIFNIMDTQKIFKLKKSQKSKDPNVKWDYQQQKWYTHYEVNGQERIYGYFDYHQKAVEKAEKVRQAKGNIRIFTLRN